MTVRDTALAAILVGMVLMFAASLVQAEDATPTQYQFTLSKVELCKSSACSSPTLLGEGSQAYDIGSAQASSGESVGSFLSNFSLAPKQTFTHLRVTVARAIDLTATAPSEESSDFNACVTGAGVDIVTASTATEALAEVTTGSVAASQEFVVPNTDANNAPGGLAITYANAGIALIDTTTMTITYQLTSSFTTGDKIPSFDVAFDVADTITFNQASATTCFVALGPPNVTITIN